MNQTKRFVSSDDVFDWLSRFIHIDRGQSYKSFRLDRSDILAKLAGNPEKRAPVIHVAGSKGKGSVTGMITAMLEAWGMKTARYTSPHITEYRERVTQGNNFFEESIYISAGEELREIMDAALSPGSPGYEVFNNQHPEGEDPSFFEVLTLYFFLCARKAKCEAMIVETGMGGRLDATNTVDPLVSIITTIELEHTEYLGETLTAIAGEKAGIIKYKRPLILLDQQDESLEVFRAVAAEKEAPLLYRPEAVAIEDLKFDKEGESFTLKFKDPKLFPKPLRVTLPIPSEIQAKNAGIAILAVKTAFPDIPEEAIIRGLGSFSLPARFERILEDPVVIIDGAHTPVSIKYCTDTFTSLYGKQGILLFGCAAQKDAQNMAKTLIPLFSKIIITAPGNYKTSYPEQVYDLFKSFIAESALPGPELLCIKDTGEAIRETLRIGKELGLPILTAGSFYLAAEIRNGIIPPG